MACLGQGLYDRFRQGQEYTAEKADALLEYHEQYDIPTGLTPAETAEHVKRQIYLQETGQMPDVEEFASPEAIVVSQTPPEEISAATYRDKYPNMPYDWDTGTVNGAGWHLDFLFSDPVGFWKSAAGHWNTLATDAEKQNYADTIRAFTIDSIPPDWYLEMFNILDLNHVNFAIQHFFPEHGEYLAFRWVAGPDNRMEEWVTGQINHVALLLNSGDAETADALRMNTLNILRQHNPAFMQALPKEKQLAFVTTLTPEVLDQIDAANIDTELQNLNAKTIMLAVAGITALVGGVALVGQIGKPKRKTQTATPAKQG